MSQPISCEVTYVLLEDFAWKISKKMKTKIS